MAREEAKEQETQYGITCPKCHEKYWMLIEFIAGHAPALKVSSRPLLSMPENAKRLEAVEVFYSQEKKWWFSRRAGKIKEIGPGRSGSSRGAAGGETV